VLADCVRANIDAGKTGMKAGEGFIKWSKDEIATARAAYDIRLKAAFDVLKLA
jgi:3-hydroxybutyryl-CoA dehydrogenase